MKKVNKSLNYILVNLYNMDMTDYSIQIDHIMDNFDFDKVNVVMSLMEWKTHNPDGTFVVTSVEELKHSGKALLTKLADCSDDTWYIETGGLRATRAFGNLHLDFVVTGWEWQPDCEEMKSFEVPQYGTFSSELSEEPLPERPLVKSAFKHFDV